VKKFCIICEKKQGFLSINYKLKDGIVCDGCVSPFGLSLSDLSMVEGATAIGALGQRNAAEIAAAIRGENEIFAELHKKLAETRNEIYSEVPPGVLFKFDGKMGEHSEDVYVYEDRLHIIIKGFASTSLGKEEIILSFRDIASVSTESGKLAYKKEFMHFLLKDGSEVIIGYSNTLLNEPKKLKEFVESRIDSGA
jgi:hypothetical protein